MAILGGSGVSLTDLNDALISGVPPRNPESGALWIDTTGGKSVLKVYENGRWVVQKLDVNQLDPDLALKIQGVIDTLGTIANDGILTFSDRTTLVKELGEILGVLPSKSTGNVYPSSLPDYTVLDSSGSGTFANMRIRAIEVGIATDTAWYKDLETAYKALNTYLSAFTPKPWDITTVSKDKNVVISTPDVFRQKFLDYYMAELRLATETEKQAKIKAEEYTEKLTEGSSIVDKTPILSGNPIYTDKADDAVVHVGVEGKSVGGGSGKNLILENAYGRYLGGNVVESDRTSISKVGNSYTTTKNPSDLIGFKSRIGIGSYVLSGETDISTVNLYYRIYNELGIALGEQVPAGKHTTASGKFSIPIKTTTTGAKYIYFGIGEYPYIKNYTISNLQIEEGSIATAYEPPAPTPDYPIAINSLDKSFDIVSSKGLTNIMTDSMLQMNGSDNGNPSSKLVDGVNVITPTANGNSYNNGGFKTTLEKIKGKKYTFSIEVNTTHTAGMYLRHSNWYSITIPNTGGTWQTVKQTYVQTGETAPGSNGSLFGFYSLQAGKEFKYRNLKMEVVEGEGEGTPYSVPLANVAYETQSPTLYKTNILLSEPLRSVGDVKDRLFLDTDGLWKVERRIHEAVIDGSEPLSLYGETSYRPYNKLNFRVAKDYPKRTGVQGKDEINSHFKTELNLGQMNGRGNVVMATAYTDGTFNWTDVYLAVDLSTASNLLEMTAYLRAQYTNGRPVTHIFPLATPTIETLPQSEQVKLNNIQSFKGSNYVYTIHDKSDILQGNLKATFKSKAWYRNYVNERDIDEVELALGGLKDFTDTSFADGVVSRAEAKAIAEHLNTLNKEKSDVDANYTTVYANTKLTGVPKTNLESAKSSWNTAHTNLINSINTAIADNKTTPAEKKDVDTKFVAYGTTFKLLTQRLQEAVIASGKAQSDSSASDAVSNLAIGGRNLVLKSGELVNTTTQYLIKSYELSEEWVEGQEYTVTIKGFINPGQVFAVYMNDGYSKLGDLLYDSSKGVHTVTRTAIKQVRPDNKLLQVYNMNSTGASKATIEWIKVVVGNKTVIDWSPAPEDLEKSVKDLKDYTDGSFKDGVVSASEAKSIGTHLNTLAKDKKDIDSNYTAIYGNAKLTGTPKTNLYNAKVAWNTAYAGLTTAITSASSGGTVTPGQIATVNSMFVTYGDALKLLTQRNQEAITAINKSQADESAQGAVDGLEIGGRNLILGSQNLGISKPSTIVNYLGKDNVTKIVDPVSSTYINPMENYSNAKIDGEDYILSVLFTYKGVKGTTPQLYAGAYTNVSGELVEGRFTRIYIKTKATARIHMNFGGFKEIYLTEWQLEKGNKATDWSPAPEDVQDYTDRKTGAPVRYIRDWQNGSTANTGNYWVELQANTANGVNRARGITPTSNLALVTPGNLTDGNLASNPYVSGTSGLQYVQIDLGKVYYDISDVSVWHYYLDGRTYHESKTEISMDGENWEPLFDSAIEGEYPATSEGKSFPTNLVDRMREITSRVSLAEQIITPESITGIVMSQETFVTWKETVDDKANGEDVEKLVSDMDNVNNSLNGTDTEEGVLTKLSRVEQTSESWGASIEELQTITNAQGEVTSSVTSYMEFKATGLEIGKSDSDMKVNISNSQIDFMDKGISVAYINGQKMYITHVEITDSLTIGNHKFSKLEGSKDVTIINWIGK